MLPIVIRHLLWVASVVLALCIFPVMLVPPLTTLWSSHPGLAGIQSLQKWKFLWCQICESAPWRWSILLRGWYRHPQHTWTSPCTASSFSFKVVLPYLLLIATTMTFHIKPTTSFMKQLTLSPFHAAILPVWVHKAGFALWCPCSDGCVFTKTLVDVGFQCGAQPLDLGRATRCWLIMVD